MSVSRVRAYLATPQTAFMCSACTDWRESGRAYEVLVSIGSISGCVTFCSACRRDFTHADLELDAPAMFDDWRARHPNEAEDAQDRLREANDWPPSPEDFR